MIEKETKSSEDKRITCEYIGKENIRNCSDLRNKCLSDEQIYKQTHSNSYSKSDISINRLNKFYDQHLFRLSLKCQIDNKKGKTMTVILMNHSYASHMGLDDTLLNVKDYLCKLNAKCDSDFHYSYFIILNVFPIRTANSKFLECLLNKYDHNCEYRNENLNYIKTKINEGGDFILAWGADYHKTDEAQKILEELNNSKKTRKLVYRLNDSKGREGTPYHFTSRIYNKVKKELQLIEVNIDSIDNKLFLKKSGILLKA